MRIAKPILASILSGLIVLLSIDGASAIHEEFEYKLPCTPGVSCYLTQQVHANGSLDFDIGGSALDGAVSAMSQGTITDLPIESFICSSSGLGRQVVISDIFQRSVIYAHLASFAPNIAADQAVYQGDILGVEGNTGFAIECAVHLHWQAGAAPEYIEGFLTSSLVVWTPQNNVYYQSTNAIIGDRQIDDTAGLAIQVNYFINGRWGDPQTGLDGVGWVHDAGRGLPMHTYGQGWEQTFRRHPDTGANEISGLYAKFASPASAFWVPPEYWGIWMESGGESGVGYPTGEKSGTCPSGAPGDCAAYQQFERGFIYTGTGGQIKVITGDLYAVSDDSIQTDKYRRLVPGAAWTDKADTPPNSSLNLMDFGGGLLFHSVDAVGATIRRSTDGGDSWVNLPTPDSSLRPVGFDRAADGRLWSLWRGSNFFRVYYSDNDGDSWTLSTQVSISTGLPGSIAAHPTDATRVAVAWVTGATALRVTVTTNQGANWTTYTPGFNGGIAPQLLWSGSRLLLAADNTSTLRLLLSQNDGANWTQQSTFTTASTSTTALGFIRGLEESRVFAFAASQDSGATHVILTSADQGSSWTKAAALPSGQLISLRAITYNPSTDTLFAAWQGSSRVTRLREASTRNWTAIGSGDWEDLPALGVTPAVRGLLAFFTPSED
jgi:hypothetical protein